jgi:hypothetical protein
VTIDFAAADPGANAITRIEVAWGDHPSVVLPGITTQATYTYPLLGTYTVRVTAQDDDGGRGSQSLTVRVEGEPRQVGGAFVPAPRELRLDFNTTLRGLTNGGLLVTNLDTGQLLPANTFAMYFDQRQESTPGRHLWRAAAALPNGNYRATLPATASASTAAAPRCRPTRCSTSSSSPATSTATGGWTAATARCWPRTSARAA